MLNNELSDFITTTCGATDATTDPLLAGSVSCYIGDSLNIPLSCGILHIDQDSDCAASATGGLESIMYDYYVSATGQLTGLIRGLNGTNDLQHDAGATVNNGISIEHLIDYDRQDTDRVSASVTIIGKNDVRPTRLVMLADPVNVIGSVDPGAAAWNDLSLSAQTSPRTFAVIGRIVSRSSGANDGILLRPNGSAATGNGLIVTQGPVANQYCSNSFIVGTDTSQVIEWYNDSVDVNSMYISIDGYFEYVD